MTVSQERLQDIVSGLLVVVLLSIGVFLWFMDQFAMQRVFGALMASELMGFAVLVYVASKPRLSDANAGWLLLGLAGFASFVFYALVLGAQ
jgi:hypothetical protein